MRKQDPLKPFLPKKKTGIDGFANDIDGKVDDAWRESMKKRVPEILWNPDHPGRKIKTEKGGQGSGNWGHQGLAGVWGGSSPTKNTGSVTKSFQPRRDPLNFDDRYVVDAPPYISPTKAMLASGNVPLFDVEEYISDDKLNKIKNEYLKQHISKVMDGEDMTPEEFENFRNSVDWIAKTACGLEGYDPETGYKVDGDFSVDFSVGDEGYADFDMTFDGSILDSRDGDIGVGKVSIEMSIDSFGERKAYIHLLAFNNTAKQRGGFGKRYMSHVEDVLFAAGADYIELEAALTVGGYFWARAGYDFEEDGVLDSFVEQLAIDWEYRYNEDIPEDIVDSIEHSWDVAMLVGPDGEKIGKDVMLGSHWFGVKYNPDMSDEEGYEIGKDYYDG